MRKAVAVPAIALLLITGCSAATADPGAPHNSDPATSASDNSAPYSSAPAAAAPPSIQAAVQDSEEQTCSKLLKTNGEGPLYQATYIYRIDDFGTSTFLGSAESARTLNEALDGIARDAPQDMGAALAALASPMANAMQTAGDPGSPWVADFVTWQGAVAELLTRCAPYESGTGDAAASSPAAPATAAEASAAFPGYPLIVDAASLDYRVGAWFGDRLVAGQVVALAPRLYAPYDPAAPDLLSYYAADRVVGDGVMKHIVFPGSGNAATFSGLQPGSQEPQ